LSKPCTLIHMSALGTDINGPTPYARTKALGELAICDVIQKSLQARAMIFRPGLVIGPEDQFLNVLLQL
jgi:nucleoside-diphosphate-sugar epimerase